MICRTCKEREADKGWTCPECRLKKRRKAAKEYKARMRGVNREAEAQAKVTAEVEQREDPADDPAVDLEQIRLNISMDVAAGERMSLPITSGVGRRYARGAEWLMG